MKKSSVSSRRSTSLTARRQPKAAAGLSKIKPGPEPRGLADGEREEGRKGK